MEAHDGNRDSEQSRLERLHDELAAILRRLPQDRRDAFKEYLSDEQEQEAGDDSRDAAKGD